MAWIVADSFDYYAVNTDTWKSVWDALLAAPDLTTAAQSRFGVGQAIHYGGVGTADLLGKTMGTNESTIYAVFAFYAEQGVSGSSPMFHIRFRDGTTNQCSVTFDSDMAIRLRSGGATGTVLATYPSAFPATAWTHFQIRVVIDGAAGSITIRKNGQTSDTFTATGLNTRGGTANNYANSLVIGNATVVAWGWRVDDMLYFSGAGAAPNTWVGDVRALCLVPVTDTAQKNFTPLITTPIAVANGSPGAGNSGSANTLYWSPLTVSRGGTITKMSVYMGGGGFSGHVQAALYADDAAGGGPGTLLATSPTILTTASGNAYADFTMPAGTYTVSPARRIWIAILADAGLNTNTGASPGYLQARTYASGFPNPAGTLNASSNNFLCSVTLAASNVVNVSEAIANGDTDYVSSSTVNDTDLYDMDDLSTLTVGPILGVVSKAFWKKTDVGTRQAQLQVKSSATTVTGPDTVLSTTYIYTYRVDPTDPATGAAWTIAGVNALQVGQKVTA